jgi:DNA adenine methylase
VEYINPLVKPFLKWAGGKRQLIPEIKKRWPSIPKESKSVYFEPFLGGGAVLFAFQPSKAIVNDVNPELINCYQVIRDSVEELLEALQVHRNVEDYYYEIRDWDRQDDFLSYSPVERAARIIFLNKTCYNGLFRVNSQGQFNVPFGRYREPTIVDSVSLRAVHKYLNEADITFLNTDFAETVALASENDFVYFDPPYDSEADSASFTSYALHGFDRNEQIRLRYLTDDLDKRRCKFLLSNAATGFMRESYRAYIIDTVEVPRAINSNPLKRGKVEEILVRNYSLEGAQN